MKTISKAFRKPAFFGGILPAAFALAITAISTAPFYLG
jgi:hypothetical protein